MDLDGAPDLHDGLVQEALGVGVMARHTAQLHEDADMAPELVDVGRRRRPGWSG